jgi:hypothetical protein
MKIWILSGGQPDWSPYTAALLRAWGLMQAEVVAADELRMALFANAIVTLVPDAEIGEARAKDLKDYLYLGGSVVAFCPGPQVRALAGMTDGGEKEGTLRLRFTHPLAAGAQGAALPVAGPARTHHTEPDPLWSAAVSAAAPPPPHHLTTSPPHAASAAPLAWAYLYAEEDYQSESVGLLVRPVGEKGGQLAVLAYHPAACVARLRQGNPERADYLPPGDNCPRPSHLFADGPHPDAGWVPFSDLHALALCDLVRSCMAATGPAPWLWSLPDDRPGLLLYSGDQDGGAPEDDEREMRDLEAVGGRMSLYLFPRQTRTTPEQAQALQQRGHTISVHPCLIPAYGQGRAAQLALAEEEVRAFQDRFGQPVRTVRNHSTAWPGYLELPELWARLGLRMDANFFSSAYLRHRTWSPYMNHGAGLPAPFVHPDGRLIDVWQQPTHLSDDVLFHATVNYSLKLSAAQFEVILDRIYDEMCQAFHVPLCVCIHPVNYARYSGVPGRQLMTAAHERGLPIWSIDRWLAFWEARDTWRFGETSWDGRRLSLTVSGRHGADHLHLAVPAHYQGQSVQEVRFSEQSEEPLPLPFHLATRHRQLQAFLPLPPGVTKGRVVVEYGATR